MVHAVSFGVEACVDRLFLIVFDFSCFGYQRCIKRAAARDQTLKSAPHVRISN